MNEFAGVTFSPTKAVARIRSLLQPSLASVPTLSRLMPFLYSAADQALSVGGPFLVNIVLARTQTKEEYGMFALSYSVFTFLGGLHNAAILEPYTVYGSGRHRARFSEYFRLMARGNVVVGLLLTGLLFCAGLLFSWVWPSLISRAFVGLLLTVGILLSGTFLRRAFYIQRQAHLAAKTSFVFLATVVCGLWLTTKFHLLDSFSVFLILALGWVTAGAGYARRLNLEKTRQSFLEIEPGYWREHWNYARWVLATAFVFQLTTQGYYWLVAGFLSVKDVAELRAIHILVAPVDQVYVALAFLFIPALASRYAANKMGNFLSLWKTYAMVTVSVNAVFATAVWILGKRVLHVLYAGKFDELAPLLFTLALLPMVVGIGHTMNDAMKAAEKPKLVFYAYACSGAATFLGGIPLVTHFGLRGAVYGMLFLERLTPPLSLWASS